MRSIDSKYQFPVLFLLLCIPLLVCPRAAADGILSGLRVAGASVIPALFPYFVISNLLLQSSINLPKKMSSVFQKLFHVSPEGLSAFLFGLIGGYPLGAKTASSLYRDNKITKQDASSLLRFCNNTGPAFFLGVAGGKILGSPAAGLCLYVIHLFSAVFCGLLFREKNYRIYSVQRKKAETFTFSQAFPQAVLQSSSAMLNISAFVVFFSGLTASLAAMPFISNIGELLTRRFGLSRCALKAVCSGALEMTSGIFRLQALKNKQIVFSLLALIITWGGFCVHFQALSQLDKDIEIKGYYGSKLLQSCVALAISQPVGALIYGSFSLLSVVPLALLPMLFLCRNLAVFSRKYDKQSKPCPLKTIEI